MKIQVFKSEFTGQLFESKKDYLLHVAQYQEEKESEEEEKELIAKTQELIHMPRLTATSIDDFRQKAFDVINQLNEGNPDKLLLLNFSNLRFTNVSNSHSAPIGFERNFRKEDDKPTSYKGWGGVITIIYSEDINSGKDRERTERLLGSFPAINTGSGGYRGKEYMGIKGYVLSYELRLYLEDFPLIKEDYQRFINLEEAYQEWQSDIDMLWDAKNKADIEILTHQNTYNNKAEKIKELEYEQYEIHCLISKRKSENNESVLLSKPFEELNEFQSLSSKFKY
jgi:hypothetical protein